MLSGRFHCAASIRARFAQRKLWTVGRSLYSVLIH